MLANIFLTGMMTAGAVCNCDTAATPSEPKPKDAARPNIILFLVDDLGWPDLACFGSTFYETPNIDRLAGEGVRFTNAYTTCHVSSPARASLLTGRYPASMNLTDWLPGRRDYPFQQLEDVEVNQDLPEEEVTIAETLRANGYHTAIIGKWHLGEGGSRPTDHGFESHIPEGYLKGWPNTYFAPFGMNGFDGNAGEYLTDRLTDEAIKYIDANKNAPFFLFFSHFAVHDPIEGRPDLVEKYRKKLASMPVSELPPFIFEGDPADGHSREELLALLDDPAYAKHKILPDRLVRIKQIQDNVQFAAMVESIDESLGRVMDCLEKNRMADNTVIVFMSDNGGMSAANYGNPNRTIDNDDLNGAYASSMLPLRGGKGWLYEGGLRIPMIISWKSGKHGRTCDTPVNTNDIYPTLLSIARIAKPAGVHLEGEDITPLMRGGKMADRALFWHFPHYSNHGQQSPGGAVRYGDYKLIEYYEKGNVQLFNLRNDSAERNDIAAANPRKVAELDRLFRQWLTSVDAKMMSPNRYYNRDVEIKRNHESASDRWWPVAGTVYDPQSNYHIADFPPRTDIYGLIRSSNLAEACNRADKLIDSGKASGEDVESLVLLWEYTDNRTYLDAAKSVKIVENNAAGLAGVLALYNVTGDEALLKKVNNLWNKMAADIEGWDSETPAFIHLSAELFALTGNAKYFNAAEKALSFAPDKLAPDYRQAACELANYAVGEVDNNLAINILTPMTARVEKKFGDGTLSVCGDIATDNRVTVTLDIAGRPHIFQRYGIELRLPEERGKARIAINGRSVEYNVSKRGYAIVRADWDTGDKITIEYR